MCSVMLTFSVMAGMVVDNFRTDIDKFVGTNSQVTVAGESGSEGSAYSYKSDYSDTKELLEAIAAVGEKMNEGGSVLLKNNGALPLTEEETKKISLLGFSSYYSVRCGNMGASIYDTEGTDTKGVDLVFADVNITMNKSRLL